MYKVSTQNISIKIEVSLVRRANLNITIIGEELANVSIKGEELVNINSSL